MMPVRSGNSPCKSVCDELQAPYLGGLELEKEGVALIEL